MNEAIEAGIQKLQKYFPKKLNKENLKKFKPYILALFLNPRFKLSHFENGNNGREIGLLYHYNNIEQDVIELIRTEYKS